MKSTNLNITKDDKSFKYIAEYADNSSYVGNKWLYEYNQNTVRIYNPDENNLTKSVNTWSSVDVSSKTAIADDFLTLKETNISYIDIYFPDYSVETYESNVRYAVTVNTWINGRTVYLGSWLINRFNALASSKVRTFMNDKYYEYIRLEMIDPWYICYADEWKPFRVNVCGSDEYDELNNEGANINISIYPVKYDEDYRIYRLIDEYDGAQNAIAMNSVNGSTFMKASMSFNFSESLSSETPGCDVHLSFNSAYEQTPDGFKEYLQETYGIEADVIQYIYMVSDSTDCYKIKTHTYEIVLDDTFVKTEDIDGGASKIQFDAWSDWRDGLKAQIIVNIIKDNIILLSLSSNSVIITKEIFKYLIADDEEINYININNIDMNLYNVNAVNKVEQVVVQLDKPSDYKANIIKPVFFKSNSISSMSIHKDVTENILINLDSYKNKVTTFYLQIEGVSFVEQGRTNAGVIFKVIGSKLPKEVTSGTAYILNEDQELVTTGTYNYI